MPNYKYNSVQEVSDAFKSGELKGYILVVDNDSSYLRYQGLEGDTDEYIQMKDEETLYIGEGQNDIYDALRAAGIPLIQAHKYPDGRLIPMEAGDYRGAFAISLFVGLPLVNLYFAYIAYLYNFKPEKI